MATHRYGLQGQYAGFVSRAAALVMDIVILIIGVIIINWLIALPLTFFFGVNIENCAAMTGNAPRFIQAFCRVINFAWWVVAVAAAPVYFTFMFATSGQTIGKYVMGLRVVRVDGRPMSVAKGFLRQLGYFISLIPLGLGFFWVVVDDRRQGFHDRLVGTVVIYAWRARQDEFILDRLRRWFHRSGSAVASQSSPQAAAALDLALSYDLVTFAFREHQRVAPVIGVIQDAIDDGTLTIVGTGVYVKGTDDELKNLAISDLAPGEQSLLPYLQELNISEAQKAQIRQDVPANSFVVAVILDDEACDTLMRAMSRAETVLTRRYELGTRAPVAASQALAGAPVYGSGAGQSHWQLTPLIGAPSSIDCRKQTPSFPGKLGVSVF